MSRFGWIRDRPDQRDNLYARALAPRTDTATLPKHVDMRSWGPVVYDQGQLGSCTANAIGAVIQFAQIRQGQVCFRPSRLFIYYNEREMEGNVESDSGAMIRSGMKSVNEQGVCREIGTGSEVSWPYDISRYVQKPPQIAYDDALSAQTIVYRAVSQQVDQLRDTLASKHPVIFGFTVYESFGSAEVARTGVVPMPEYFERVLGGHAVVAVGYDDATQRFICRNSWGTGWGQAGYFTIPYQYVDSPDLAADFWMIELVE